MNSSRPWLPTVAAALSLAVVALASAPASASTTAHLRGYLFNDEDKPVEGARVTLDSKQILGEPRHAVTDARGLFRFGELPVGRYDLRIEADGFLTKELLGVRLELDRVVEVKLALTTVSLETAGGVERERAPERGVDPRRVATGRSFLPSFTDKIATGRSPQSLAMMLPGVVADDRNPTLPVLNGGSAFGNAWFLDGIYVTDPGTGGPAGAVSFDSIDETLVLSAGLDAEYGYTRGGVINIATSQGQDTFDFDGSVLWSPAELRLGDETERTQVSGLMANLSASGPILPGKLWFNTSVQFIDDTRTTPLETPVFLETPFMPPRQDREFDLLGRLTWRPLHWQKLGLILQTDPGWLTNAQQEPLRHPRAERQLYNGGLKTGIWSETRLFEHVVWRNQIVYGIDQLETTPVSNQPDLPGHINLATNTITENAPERSNDYRIRGQIDSHVSVFLADILGTHEIKVGANAMAMWNYVEQSLNGGQTFLDNGFDGPGSDISTTGDPYQVRRAAPLSKLVTGNTVSGYIQDVWNPWPNLTIRPGLRFDSARAYASGDNPNLFAPGPQLYNFNWPSPRIGMSWDPFGEGKTAIRAGYYHYADMGRLNLATQVGRGLETETYAYNPATEQYDIFVNREGGEDGVIPGVGFVPPTMHEIIIGASQEVFLDASVHADLIFRQSGNLFEDTETNIQWNADGSAATGFANGNPEPVRVLSAPTQAIQRYIALNLVFDKRLSDRWTLYASYTLSQLEGTVEGGPGYALDNPRQAPWEFGYLRNDVRHNARVFLTYDLPYGLTVGLTGQYQSGRPYSKLFYNATYDDFVDRRAPRGFDPVDVDDEEDDRELRLPDQFQVDMRLSWKLKELTTQDIWVILEIRNVLNQRPTTAVEERYLLNDPTAFGQPISRVEPLRATLGLRYRF
jgi:hypothetical protein